jgi:hypothetical protein
MSYWLSTSNRWYTALHRNNGLDLCCDWLIVVSEFAEVKIHVNMLGIEQDVEISTIPKPIDPVEKNSLRIEQLNEQLQLI